MAKRGLGKGLGSLFPSLSLGMEEGLRELPVSSVVASRRQPRRHFDEESLAELAASIERHGVVQPIVVRPCGEQYEIIAGERRWRAAVRAGVSNIPAVVRDSDDQQSLQLALIENLQRNDISAVEEAYAYRILAEEYGMAHEEIAKTVGKSRAAVSNTLRLLNLPEEIQDKIVDGTISAGHARALLSAPEGESQLDLAEKIVSEGLTVRNAEELVKTHNNSEPRRSKAEPMPERVEEAARLIENKLGFKVKIRYKDGKGKLVISFTNDDELTALADKVYLLPD